MMHKRLPPRRVFALHLLRNLPYVSGLIAGSLAFAAACLLLAPLPASAQLNLYCSSPNTAWCEGMANGFEKATG